MSDECNDSNENGIEGRYANNFKVGYNAFEFILDFTQYYEDEKETRFHARVVTSPAYAKAFSRTLRQAIDQYEQTFGMISKEYEK